MPGLFGNRVLTTTGIRAACGRIVERAIDAVAATMSRHAMVFGAKVFLRVPGDGRHQGGLSRYLDLTVQQTLLIAAAVIE
jgi:hypothetical protein